MNNRDSQIVLKILSEVTMVEELIEGFDLDKFTSDERTKRAVCMTLINIGERQHTIIFPGAPLKV